MEYNEKVDERNLPTGKEPGPEGLEGEQGIPVLPDTEGEPEPETRHRPIGRPTKDWKKEAKALATENKKLRQLNEAKDADNQELRKQCFEALAQNRERDTMISRYIQDSQQFNRYLCDTLRSLADLIEQRLPRQQNIAVKPLNMPTTKED